MSVSNSSKLIRVLHVDDEPGFLKATKQILEMQGNISVEMVLSVKEAQVKMQKEVFDVIVSDYQMPDKDALEFIRDLRENGNTIPFIVFTGRGREEVAIVALNLGADGYFNKVGDPETVYGELVHGIRHAVEGKRAENIIQQQNEFLKNTIDSLPHPFLVINADDFTIQLANSATGFNDQRKKSTCYELTHKREAPCGDKQVCPLEEVKQTKKPVIVEHSHYDKDGHVKNFEVHGYPIFDDTGNVVQMLEYQLDITERKKVEEELIRLSIAVKMSSDSIVISDLEGKIVYVNDPPLKMYNAVNREDLIGKNALDLIAPEDREKMTEGARELMYTGYLKGQEFNIFTNDGSRIPVEVNVSVMKDRDGKPMGFVSVSRDITERKAREEDMKRRLMRFRLDDGNLYLVKESSSALSIETFKDLLNVGYHGLVISRTPENEFKKNVDGSFEFRWLAESGGEKSLSPKFDEIEKSLEKMLKKSVILLDGLDYLVLKNGFKETLFFVQHLRELTYLKSIVVILSVDPATLSAREVRLLEKEAREVESRVFVRLPEDLLEILRFIHEHNALGSKPNYSEVRQELGISKPTVGKRIKILVNTGYVMENRRGRSKILELTQKGVRLFLR